MLLENRAVEVCGSCMLLFHFLRCLFAFTLHYEAWILHVLPDSSLALMLPLTAKSWGRVKLFWKAESCWKVIPSITENELE